MRCWCIVVEATPPMLPILPVMSLFLWQTCATIGSHMRGHGLDCNASAPNPETFGASLFATGSVTLVPHYSLLAISLGSSSQRVSTRVLGYVYLYTEHFYEDHHETQDSHGLSPLCLEMLSNSLSPAVANQHRGSPPTRQGASASVQQDLTINNIILQYTIYHNLHIQYIYPPLMRGQNTSHTVLPLQHFTILYTSTSTSSYLLSALMTARVEWTFPRSFQLITDKNNIHSNAKRPNIFLSLNWIYPNIRSDLSLLYAPFFVIFFPAVN